MGAQGAKGKRKLTARQTAVLGAVERLGRPGMLELSPEFGFAASEIARVLEVLEERGIVARSGDPELIYTGGVRWWAMARGGEPQTEKLQALLEELVAGELGLEGWIAPEQQAVVLYLPLRSIERELRGGDERFSRPADRIRELTTDGRVAGVEVGGTVTSQKGEPSLEVRLAPTLEPPALEASP
jgi:hypothetical protein